MTEYYGLEQLEGNNLSTIATIGNFDGVHKGHQELIKLAVEKGKENNLRTMAVTFHPHPMKCIKPGNHPPTITPLEQKIELLNHFGLDDILIIKFTKEFANLGAAQFIEDILVNTLKVKAVVVGKDYMFGKSRQGDINFLKEYGKTHNFKVFVPEWIKLSDQRISSTLIRESVTSGKLDLAKSMLGRFYQIRGKVVHGRNRGSKLGFPTANLELIDELCPKTGVYAVIPEIDNVKYKGVANIGYSPTFGEQNFTVEVHFLDFKEDLYGRKIKVSFVQRLRGEKKFSGIEELSDQISKDIGQARKILGSIV
ncbi:MAG: bifunctional riboflavin kinase/FAD synthetase [Desulforegulaceae bacterium]|nr:bifunctional riboflavin kinase/FAD synthetase [Desulforegulaceae bacterium]